MKLDKDSYTKEEVEGFFKDYESKLTDLNTKLEDGNKAIEKVKELEKNNLTNAIKLEAVKSGLDVDEVFDLIDAESLEKAQAKINKLVEMKKQEKIDNSYKPEGRKSTNEYLEAEKNKDVEGMLKSKISKLFN